MELDRQIARASATLIFGNLLALLLGVATTLVIAAHFGTREEMDAFALARVVPDAAWVLLSLAIPRSFLPLFARHQDDPAALSRAYSSTLNLLALLGLLLGAATYLGAPWLVAWLVPADRPRVQDLATEFVRIFSLVFPASCMWHACTALFQANHRFLAPPLAQALGRLAMLTVILASAGRWGIHGAVAGLLAYHGVALLLLGAGGSRLASYRPRAPLGLAWAVGRQVFGPLLLLSALEQLHGLLLRGVAVGLPQGRVAALDYATAVVSLFYVLLVVGPLQAVYAYLGRADEVGTEELARTAGVWLRTSLTVMLPLSAWLVLLREPLVTALFARGAFSAASVALTKDALCFFLAGLLPMAVAGLLELVLITRGRLRWCLALKILGVTVSLGGAYLLSRQGDLRGLGAGIALGYAVQAAAGLALCRYRLELRFPGLAAAAAGAAVAAAPGAWLLMSYPVPPAAGAGLGAVLGLAAALALRLAAAAALYLAVARVLRMAEFDPVWRWIRRA